MADTQRSVNEKLQWYRGLSPDFLDLIDAQLTTQHHLFKAQAFQFLDPFQRKVVALCAGMQRNGRQVEFQQRKVLYNQRIHTSVPAIPSQTPSFFLFILVKQGVQGHVHLSVKQRCMTAKLLYILDAISRFLTGTEGRTADIHGIGAMIDGSDAYLNIFSGGKKLDRG